MRADGSKLLSAGESCLCSNNVQTALRHSFSPAITTGEPVPRALGDLGVSKGEWERHIAWDIGIAGVTTQLSRR